MPTGFRTRCLRSPLGALLLLLLLRALLVLALADVFFYGEELEKGTAAKALLDGLALDWRELAYHPYEGGGFVVSLLKALAFLAVGPNVLAHKLVALVTSALVLWLGWRLLERHCGLAAAWIWGLLQVFAPATWQKLGLLSLGIHYEASVFFLIVLDLLLRWSREARAPTRREAFGFGLAGGFGFYCNYQLVLPIAFAAAWLLLRQRRSYLGPALPCALLGAALGLAPLAWTAARFGRAVLDVHGVAASSASERWQSLATFVGELAAPGHRLLLGALPLVLLALLPAFRSERTRVAARLLSLFALLWLLVYSQSSFVVAHIVSDFSWMRFAPLWIVLQLLLAAGLSAAWSAESRAARLYARAFCAAWFLCGSAGTYALVRDGAPATPLANLRLLRELAGYDYAGWMAKVWPRLEAEPLERARALLAFAEPHQELLLADLASVATPGLDDPEAFIEALAENDPARAAALRLGCGQVIARRARAASGGGLAEILAWIGAQDGASQAWQLRALGRSTWDWAVTPERIRAEAEQAALLGAASAYGFGLGERAWRWLVLTPYGGQALQVARAQAFIESLPSPLREPARQGFEHARGLSTLVPP